MRTILKAFVIVLLTPIALCLGVYGCTMAHVAALSHGAETPLACPPSTAQAAARADLAALPVKACIMRSQAGEAYRCSRRDGCLKCGVVAPCPGVRL